MLVHTVAQRFDALAHLGLLQRGDPVGKPGLQLLKLHPLYLVAPGRDLLVVLLVAAQLDEIYAGDRVPAADAAGLQAGELLPLPTAMVAAQIVGRQTHQQHLRGSQALAQPQLPVLAVVNLGSVEKDPERLGRKRLKSSYIASRSPDTQPLTSSRRA